MFSHMCAELLGGQKKALDPLEQELQFVGAVIWTHILCESI